MNVWVGIAALVVASNAARRRAALSVDDTTTVGIGAALAGVVLVLVGAVATPLLDAMDVSPPNLRIGVGIVLVLVSAHDLVRRPPTRGAALPGRRAAIVPVAFPVLLRPEVAFVALALGADHGVAITALAAALAMGAVVGWHAFATPRAEDGTFTRVERGVGIFTSALGVVLAMVIAVDGVFAI